MNTRYIWIVVVLLFIVAFAVAGGFAFWTRPGEPARQPSPHAIDQSQ